MNRFSEIPSFTSTIFETISERLNALLLLASMFTTGNGAKFKFKLSASVTDSVFVICKKINSSSAVSFHRVVTLKNQRFYDKANVDGMLKCLEWKQKL